MRTIFLDLETTGLDPVRDEILEIGILDDEGEILLDTLVHPQCRTAWPSAQKVNGIDPSTVADAPSLAELRTHISAVVAGARVVIYNASFDSGFLVRELAGAGEVACAMRAFAQVFGEWSHTHGTWRRKKLAFAAHHVGYVWPGNAHRAIQDCMATRAVWHWTNAQATPIQTAPAAPRVHRTEP